jgi:hypothetical protein
MEVLPRADEGIEARAEQRRERVTRAQRDAVLGNLATGSRGRAAMLRVRDSKDFWSGILFVAFGCAGLWFGAEYRIGSAAQMGPGYFPLMMSLALVGIGGLIAGRAVIFPGEQIERIAIRPQVLILAAIIVFGLLIERVGLAISVAAVAVVSGLAAQGMRRLELAVLAIALAAGCVLLFVVVLGQPIPIWIRPWI